jgi:hypothetical protein
MRKINKKAISDLVGTVLITSLVVIAVALLATYLSKSSDLSPEIDCLQSQINKNLEIKDACYNSNTGDVELKVSRNPNDKNIISEIEFTLTYSDEIPNSKFYCGGNCNNAQVPVPGKTETYLFSSKNTNLGEIHIGAGGCFLDSFKIRSSC